MTVERPPMEDGAGMATDPIDLGVLVRGFDSGCGGSSLSMLDAAASAAAPAPAGLVAAPARPLGEGWISLDELLGVLVGLHPVAPGTDAATPGDDGAGTFAYPR